MTNIHFLEMIHLFDDIIQIHVLLQLQEETDVASRLVLISYLEMEMLGNRSNAKVIRRRYWGYEKAPMRHAPGLRTLFTIKMKQSSLLERDCSLNVL